MTTSVLLTESVCYKSVSVFVRDPVEPTVTVVGADMYLNFDDVAIGFAGRHWRDKMIELAAALEACADERDDYDRALGR